MNIQADFVLNTDHMEDYNIPSKSRGHLSLEPSQFVFTSPDRGLVDFTSLDEYIQIAEQINTIGEPNHKIARYQLKPRFQTISLRLPRSENFAISEVWFSLIPGRF